MEALCRGIELTCCCSKMLSPSSSPLLYFLLMCSQQGVGGVESGSHSSWSTNLESWSKPRLASVLDLSFCCFDCTLPAENAVGSLHQLSRTYGWSKVTGGVETGAPATGLWQERFIDLWVAIYILSQAPVRPVLVTCDDGHHPCCLSNVLTYAPSHSVLKNLYLHFSQAANLHDWLLFSFFDHCFNTYSRGMPPTPQLTVLVANILLSHQFMIIVSLLDQELEH